MSDNNSAFPIQILDGDGKPCCVSYGLTKREYFAAKALAGMLSYRETHAAIGAGKLTPFDVVNAAVSYADALIAALNKPAETGGVK